MNGGEVNSVFCVYVRPLVAQITLVQSGHSCGYSKEISTSDLLSAFRVFFRFETSTALLDRSSSAWSGRAGPALLLEGMHHDASRPLHIQGPVHMKSRGVQASFLLTHA